MAQSESGTAVESLSVCGKCSAFRERAAVCGKLSAVLRKLPRKFPTVSGKLPILSGKSLSARSPFQTPAAEKTDAQSIRLESDSGEILSGPARKAAGNRAAVAARRPVFRALRRVRAGDGGRGGNHPYRLHRGYVRMGREIYRLFSFNSSALRRCRYPDWLSDGAAVDCRGRRLRCRASAGACRLFQTVH